MCIFENEFWLSIFYLSVAVIFGGFQIKEYPIASSISIMAMSYLPYDTDVLLGFNMFIFSMVLSPIMMKID